MFALASAGILAASLIAQRQRKKSIIARFWHNLGKTSESPESIREGREFVPRPDDIFIVTYPKSGTTWMQQICHGLRTKGDMSFDEITCVVPWNITAKDCGQSVLDEQPLPRCFKTHDTFSQCPKGAKYIVVVRDPRDVLVSFHAFLCDWAKTDPEELTVLDFANVLFCAQGSGAGDYWSHLAGWLHRLEDPNTLFIFFEDLKADLGACVRRVADFMGISDQEAIEIATKQSTFDFMRDHMRQFDDHFLATNIYKRSGYFVELMVGKVRDGGGRVGGHKDVLSKELLARLDARWQEIIVQREKLPFPNYDVLYKQHRLKM